MLKYLAPFAFAGAVFCGTAFAQDGAAVPVPAGTAMAEQPAAAGAEAVQVAVQAELKAVQEALAAANEAAKKEDGGMMTAMAKSVAPALSQIEEQLKAQVAAIEKNDPAAAEAAAKAVAAAKAGNWAVLMQWNLGQEMAAAQAKAEKNPALKEAVGALVTADTELAGAIMGVSGAEENLKSDNAEAKAKAETDLPGLKETMKAKEAARAAALDALKKAEEPAPAPAAAPAETPAETK